MSRLQRVCALALGLLSPLGAAASVETEDSSTLQEVIVTARGTPEPAWTVPLSMTTLTGPQIEHAGIRDLDDLAAAVPGLAYSYARGQGGTPVIRGMAATNISSNQNNVATLFGGLYISNAYAIDVGMLDLAGIEVLRGPQNALVGRNAFAGAILYDPAKPTATLQGAAQLSAGGDAFGRESAFISGPLSSQLSARLAAVHESFGGTIHNLGDPLHNLGGWNKSATSVTLLWQPSDRRFAELSGYWYENQREAEPRTGFGPVSPLFNCGRDAADGGYINYCGAIPAATAVDITADARGLTSRTALARLELQWRGSFATLVSLTGFIQTRLDNAPDDSDLTSAGQLIPVAQLNAPDVVTRMQRANTYFSGFPLDDHEWSEELRLSGEARHLQWLLGLYWADNRSLTHVGGSADARGLSPQETFVGEFYPGTDTPLALLPLFAGAGNNRISSVFGAVSYSVSESLSLSADVRWSTERERDQSLSLTGGAPDSPRSGSWAFVTPRFTVTYRWPQDVQGYVSAAKGARSGGFNDSPLPAEAQFSAETNWTYELGLKSGGANRRMHVSAAVYRVNWSDMQIESVSLDPTFPFPITRNAGDVTVQGLDFALDGRATRWMDLRLEYAHAKARFNSGTIDLSISNTCTQQICHLVPSQSVNGLVPDVGGNQLPLAPQDSIAAVATLHGNLPWELRWEARPGLEVASREYVRTDNLSWIPARQVPSVRLSIAGVRWEVALWGRNLTATARSSFVTTNTSDIGVRRFIADRANGASWGASFVCHFP